MDWFGTSKAGEMVGQYSILKGPLDVIGMGPEYRHGLGWDLKIWSDGWSILNLGPGCDDGGGT
jgi:hypothetical protein